MVFQARVEAFQLSTHLPEAPFETNQAKIASDEPFRHPAQSRFVLPRAPNALPRAPNVLPWAPNALPRAPDALPQASRVLPQASRVLPQAWRVLP